MPDFSIFSFDIYMKQLENTKKIQQKIWKLENKAHYYEWTDLSVVHQFLTWFSSLKGFYLCSPFCLEEGGGKMGKGSSSPWKFWGLSSRSLHAASARLKASGILSPSEQWHNKQVTFKPLAWSNEPIKLNSP